LSCAGLWALVFDIAAFSRRAEKHWVDAESQT
jgi:hypothetical protein